jgi:hypothetical protein
MSICVKDEVEQSRAAIRRLFQSKSFDPKEVSRRIKAFRGTLANPVARMDCDRLQRCVRALKTECPTPSQRRSMVKSLDAIRTGSSPVAIKAVQPSSSPG